MFDLTGKTALVTGSASGIGEAIARAMSASGAFVFVADVNDSDGRRVADDVGGEFVRLDVSDASACGRVAERALGERGRLDILVNNAGVGHVGTILETAESDLERLFAINVRGMFSLTKSFLPSMIAAGGGAIVNVASIGGVVAIKDRLAYCTTKFAVVGFTKCLALDHAKQGIRANAVCPGRVETALVSKLISDYPDPQAAYDQMAATQAVGRMGKPEEIASAVLYLASDEAAFVTGTAFEVDGGFSVGK